MKKLAMIFLAVVLALIPCFAFAEEGGAWEWTGPEETVTLPAAGFKIAVVPESPANSGSAIPIEAIGMICEKYGYELNVYDGQSDAATMVECYLNAISWGADAVIGISTDESKTQQGIAACYEANIPVFGLSNGTDDPNPKLVLPEGQYNLLCDVGPDYQGLGYMMAEWVNANNPDKGTVVVYDILGLMSVENHRAGLLRGFDDLGVEYEYVEISFAQLGDQLNRMVTGYIQSHPNCRFVSIPADPFAVSVIQAIDAAGLEGVQVISVLGNPEFNALLEGPTSAGATAAYDSYFMGFGCMDQMFRYLATGKFFDPHGEGTPIGIVDRTNVPATGERWKPEFDYVEKFFSLWVQE